ncbi:MAG: UDP-N-acetylmuramoyl-tripeptide--D-alanyl-D-alanine ligase, partial [Oscillospiraceae bacterium]|nr:UDP-N-acetylmuramoyl-tripeptide--D-alanyl-D-alanine ligase [Oscillospiraceae bacterium]
MKRMTLKAAAEACGGKLTGCPDPGTGIGRAVIDSRAVEAGDLFVAFRGEKTDGHRYIRTALEKGAVCALAEYLPEDVEGPAILVG